MEKLTALEYVFCECWMYGLIVFTVLAIAFGCVLSIVLFVKAMTHLLTKRGGKDG